MSRLCDAVVEFLDAADLQHQILDGGVVRIGVTTDSAVFAAFIGEEDDDLTVHCVLEGQRVPPVRRLAVAEFLCRVNERLRMGAFRIDFDDGEVRFVMGSIFVDMQPSRKALERLVMTPLAMSDQIHASLMAVCYGGRSPVEALDEMVIGPEADGDEA